MSAVLDMWGWLFYVVGMIIWTILFTISFSSTTMELSPSGYIGEQITLVTLLRTPTSDGLLLADDIVRAASGDMGEQSQPVAPPAFTGAATWEPSTEMGETQKRIDQLLNSIYGQARSVCWGLWADERLVMQVSCEDKVPLLDERAILPTAGTPIRIRLAVLGYAS